MTNLLTLMQSIAPVPESEIERLSAFVPTNGHSPDRAEQTVTTKPTKAKAVDPNPCLYGKCKRFDGMGITCGRCSL